MTYLEAIEKIENRAAILGMVDQMGDPYEPTEVIAWAAAHHGRVWAEVNGALMRGEIDLTMWADACCQLIDEFGRERQRIRIERHLAGLAADQRELA